MLEEKLKELILEKYGSIRQFAIKIDIPYTIVDTILKKGINNSNIGNVIKICKSLNISVDKLVDTNEIISTLSFDNTSQIELSNNSIQIPVFVTIKAGSPIEAQQNVLEYIDIPEEWVKTGKKFYGLKISGDSMYPKYNENDIVIFEHNQDFSFANKKDCAVMVNGYDATFKNVTITESGITLVPLNINNKDNYQPTFYDKEQIENLPVRIVGIARKKRTRL